MGPQGRDETLKGVSLFVQIRLGSQRLPHKALKPLGPPEYGETLTSLVLKALSRVPCRHHVVLTDEASFSALKPLAEKGGFQIMAGPARDVLKRFALACERFPSQAVIRATGDNPLVSPEVAAMTWKLFQKRRADYAGLLGIPLGTGVEVIRTSALREAHERAQDPFEREHVAPYLYRRPGEYRIAQEFPDEEALLLDQKVTLDTPEDYRYIDSLMKEIYRGDPIPIRQLVAWLKTNQKPYDPHSTY